MPDGLSFSIITKPLTDDLAARTKTMDRAAMWALRETGRVCRVAAKVDAPVYRGGMTQKAWRADRRAAGIHAPVSGLLRSSIKSSRRMGGFTGFRTITIAPRGNRVRLYSGKINALVLFMQRGQAAAEAAAPAIWARAVAHVMG